MPVVAARRAHGRPSPTAVAALDPTTGLVSMPLPPSHADVVVSPPFVYIPQVEAELRKDFKVAAQNCWVKAGGAYTGEIRCWGPPVVVPARLVVGHMKPCKPRTNLASSWERPRCLPGFQCCHLPNPRR